ncbi:hypothetical protein ACFL34_05685, partial [Candidatus Sumerlaeota bacterium]
GSNYARSMASYALLNAFSGFSFDMTRGAIGFDPLKRGKGKGKLGKAGFRCFWSLDTGWGQALLEPDRLELRLLYGSLRLNALDLPSARKASGAKRDAAWAKARRAELDGQRLAFSQAGRELRFEPPLELEPDQTLRLRLGP